MSMPSLPIDEEVREPGPNGPSQAGAAVDLEPIRSGDQGHPVRRGEDRHPGRRRDPDRSHGKTTHALIALFVL